jgi:hypothetical protein
MCRRTSNGTAKPPSNVCSWLGELGRIPKASLALEQGGMKGDSPRFLKLFGITYKYIVPIDYRLWIVLSVVTFEQIFMNTKLSHFPFPNFFLRILRIYQVLVWVQLIATSFIIVGVADSSLL